MSNHFSDIYRNHAPTYEALIAREDYQGNLLAALQAIVAVDKQVTVVEMGAGTGRLTRLLAPLVRYIVAGDAAPAMLSVAQTILAPYANCALVVADNRTMPLPPACADVVIEGWSFGHLCGWYPDTWQVEVQRAINEMQRLLRPNGTAILIETLGTGHTTPTPPTPALAQLYTLLEADWGFTRRVIRTDYQFADLAEAVHLTRFFFGEALATQVAHHNWQILPECTGIWFRK